MRNRDWTKELFPLREMKLLVHESKKCGETYLPVRPQIAIFSPDSIDSEKFFRANLESSLSENKMLKRGRCKETTRKLLILTCKTRKRSETQCHHSEASRPVDYHSHLGGFPSSHLTQNSECVPQHLNRSPLSSNRQPSPLNSG